MADDPDPGSRAGVQVVGFDRTDGGFGDLDRLVAVARVTLIDEGLATGNLDLVAVEADEMADLNATHMGHDGPTDVLSFPLDADEAMTTEHDGPTIGLPLHLGDVIICPAVARSQAPEHCGSEQAELSLLVIHGVLHVLGHDHAEPDQAAAMEARERHHLEALGYEHPGAQAAAC